MALEPRNPGLLERLGHFFTKSFYGKDMKKHQSTIDNLHSEESKKHWDEFSDKAKDKSFVKAVNNDPRSDEKLKMHVKRLNEMHEGKQMAQISGSNGKVYIVSKLPSGDFGCTCNDWRYKGSVNPGYRCKHIKEFIARSKNK